MDPKGLSFDYAGVFSLEALVLQKAIMRTLLSMRQISIGWLIGGTVFGAIGFAYDLITLSAIINGLVVGRTWMTLAVVLCPWFIPLRNIWGILALNCFLYALLFEGIRFAWVRLRDSAVSK